MTLASFEDQPVIGSSIELPNAAGGLREALDIEPAEFHMGDEFTVAFKCRVRKLRFDPVDKDELDAELRRIHVADVIQATLVKESDVVGDALASMAERVEAARQIKGQQKMATAPPFLGFDDLTTDEVCERVEQLADDGDLDLIDRIAGYEEANGGRGKIVEACAAARQVLDSKP